MKDNNNTSPAMRAGRRLSSLLLAIILGGCGGGDPGNDTGSNIDTGKIYRWKMVTTWPANFPVFQEAPEMFAENVRIMSNGRLDINVFAGGELVPALQVQGAGRTVFFHGSFRHGTERCGSLAVPRRRPGIVE